MTAKKKPKKKPKKRVKRVYAEEFTPVFEDETYQITYGVDLKSMMPPPEAERAQPAPLVKALAEIRFDSNGSMQLLVLGKKDGQTIIDVGEYVKNANRKLSSNIVASATDNGNQIEFRYGDKTWNMNYPEAEAIWNMLDAFVRHTNLTGLSDPVPVP